MGEDKTGNSMKSIYIETTIPSLLAARQSRNMISAAHQVITRNFWENERQNYDLYISQFVLDECAKGDPEAAKRRLEVIAGMRSLPVSKEVIELAPRYKQLLEIPDRANIDAFHLAISVIAEMDYLLSWNFTHMGVVSYGKLLKYNEREGFKTPLLITPEAFMNYEKDMP
jgi:hypothetical protein